MSPAFTAPTFPALKDTKAVWPNITVAQYRMLGRIVRGELLPHRRYWEGTIMALFSKGYVAGGSTAWAVTDRGRAIYAAAGKLSRLPSGSLGGT